MKSYNYSNSCHCERNEAIRRSHCEAVGRSNLNRLLCRFASRNDVLFFIVGFLLCAFYFPCYAEDAISSSELINNARQYDGKEVVYRGEVIGDIMARKGFAWINVNDGVNAIGAWSNKDLIKDIIYTGSYKSKGDVVEIKGIFNRACLEHGGDLDIHIDELRKINDGMVVNERVDIVKKNHAFVLLGILGLVIIASQIKEKHK